jgi:acyl-coenzyme A synthetase/AMP-(fatty) acid ligase
VADSRSLVDRLAEHASRRPDSVALVAGERRVTYRELAGMTAAARRRIARLGLHVDSPVGIHAAKSPETIALLTACLLAGRRFLVPSTELGTHTLGTLFERAGCIAVLTATPLERHVHEGWPPVTVVDCAPDRAVAQVVPGSRRGVSFMLTTSGSTGVPKIVPLGMSEVDRFTDWAIERFGIEPGTRVLNYAPLNFDLCLLDVWATLKAGGTVVLVAPEKATNGRYLSDLLHEHEVELVQSVPMFFRLVADAADRDFPAVRQVILTGDAMPARLLPALPQLFPNARVANVYGCTETNDSFLYDLPAHIDEDTALPIGRPLPGVDVLLVDGDGVAHQGPATGELLVHTPFQTEGYLGGPGQAEKFVRHQGIRYFRTGDLVSRDADGTYTLMGRNDFQVKVRGTRVNLQEIEHVLLDHGRVLEAAVVGLPDDLAGQRVHAVIRCDEPVSSLALREHCRLRLPRVAIPSAIHVVDSPLPTTSTGKVDRRAISSMLAHTGVKA